MVRRRVLFKRSGVQKGMSLRSLPSRQPRTTHEAIRMIAKRQIPVRGSLELQSEYERINREFFKGKLPYATVILADLPNVKHRAFTTQARNLRIIVINTAHSKTLEEQRADLRHEIIHVAGVKGHGTLFEIYAEMLNAPLATSPEGKPLYKEDYDKLMAEMERKKRIQKTEVKRDEGLLMKDGKVVARVMSWTSSRTVGEVVPKTSITRYEQVPKSAKEVTLVLFDNLGYPKRDPVTIPREKLEEYYLTT